MTVRELIEILSAEPPDALVLTYNHPDKCLVDALAPMTTHASRLPPPRPSGRLAPEYEFAVPAFGTLPGVVLW